MYAKLKGIPDIASHMPDFKEGEYPERKYWNQVLCILYLSQMYDLIVEAQSKRRVDEFSKKNDMIELTPKIADEITNLVTMPSKLGIPKLFS